jgi:hypothetical protein
MIGEIPKGEAAGPAQPNGQPLLAAKAWREAVRCVEVPPTGGIALSAIVSLLGAVMACAKCSKWLDEGLVPQEVVSK